MVMKLPGRDIKEYWDGNDALWWPLKWAVERKNCKVYSNFTIVTEFDYCQKEFSVMWLWLNKELFPDSFPINKTSKIKLSNAY